MKLLSPLSIACCLMAVGIDAFNLRADDNPARSKSPKPGSKFFRSQYQIPDLSFCNASVCVDFDDDGKREVLFASRKTKRLQMLNAADGTVRWSQPLAGDQQSMCAYDLDGDGDFEILYSVSGPGRLYVLDHSGRVLKQWDAGDWKLGNSAVIIDADGDGILDGYFGTRGKYLVRLNMRDLTLISRRPGWVQCGCYTTAMDVDNDGRWDFFAGSGDDHRSKGVLHRYDPRTLKTVWSYRTDDNASSADMVLVDIDGDNQVEIIKSVDNYKHDDPHDALYAFETDGRLLWKVEGLSGEDSPNAADLDGDGSIEIVGMTFGGEVYCLDHKGRFKWRKDLRPEMGNSAHAYMAPILCDVDGDRELEVLAMTNGGYFNVNGQGSAQANGVVFALSADGEILDSFDVGGPRYWGDAFYCNIDDDPFMELVVSGSGGLDVIQTKGFGPDVEVFQRRRTYQRLNVIPWAYEDTYFIGRGRRRKVAHQADSLVLKKMPGAGRRQGEFITQLLTLPPGCEFDRIKYECGIANGTAVSVNVLDQIGKPILKGVTSGQPLQIRRPVRLQFLLTSSDSNATPIFDEYSLSFQRRAK